MRLLTTLAVLCIALSAHAARLRGTIVNPLADTVEVVFWNAHRYKMETLQAALDARGRFSLELPTEYLYNEFTLRNGQEQTDVVIERGAALALVADGKSFDASMRYSGAKSPVANFMAERMRERKSLSYFSREMSELALETPSAAVEKGRQAVKDEMDFLQKHSASLPESFKTWWTARFDYEFYGALTQYPFFREARRLKTYEVDNIPAENYAVLDAVPLRFDDAFIGLSSYGHYVTGIHAAKADAQDGRATGEA